MLHDAVPFWRYFGDKDRDEDGDEDVYDADDPIEHVVNWV